MCVPFDSDSKYKAVHFLEGQEKKSVCALLKAVAGRPTFKPSLPNEAMAHHYVGDVRVLKAFDPVEARVVYRADIGYIA